MIECFFAVWKLGAIAAPINFRENDEGVLRMLKLAGAGYVVCEDQRISSLSASADGIRFIAESGSEGLCIKALRSVGIASEAADIPDDTEQLYIFTSGTTGDPKAVVHTKKTLVDFVLKCYERGGLYDQNDVFLSYSPLCHIGGMRIMLGNLLCGATLVLTASFDPLEVVSLIERERVSQMFVIPPSMIMRLKTLPEAANCDMSALKKIRLSGGLCTVEAVEKIFEYFGDVTLISGFGSSEGAVSTFNLFDREQFNRDPNIVRSIGKPLSGCEVRLYDNDGRLVERPGIPGEAFGKCGYKFTRYQTLDGSEDAAEWFKTGDLFCFDQNGNYYFKGRTRDIIKTGGENVFSGEVEATVGKHPDVAECAVFSTKHETLGEAITAAIVLKSGHHCTGMDILNFCRQNSASYKKPIKIFFVDSLPKTATGKVRKSELQELAEKGLL